MLPENLREAFWNGFLEALYFTETGDVDQPEPGIALDPEAELDLKADCRSFLARANGFISYNAAKHGQTFEQAGRDFWLTRNGHGAGFWDGDWPWAGDRLSRIANGYGEVDLFEIDGRLCK